MSGSYELMPALIRILPFSVYLVAFLVGSIPFGLLMARLFHVRDLTRQGSGNIGATNVSRVVGFWPAGFLTFSLDALKGAFPVLLFTSPILRNGLESWMTSMGPDGAPAVDFTTTTAWIAGLLAVLGHCYSPWLRFRGGKGVATAFGVAMVASPLAAIFGILAFGITFYEKRIGSLASLTGLIVTAIVHLVLHPVESYLWAGAAMILVILIRHESNINALLEDREKPFGTAL